MKTENDKSASYYADVAFKCSNNPGIAAWVAGIYSSDDDRIEIVSGVMPRSTNSEIAALGIYGALEVIPEGSEGLIRLRDQTTIVSITDRLSKWEANDFLDPRGKPIGNTDLWMRLSGRLKLFPKMGFEWVDRETGSMATLGREAARLVTIEKRKKR